MSAAPITIRRKPVVSLDDLSDEHLMALRELAKRLMAKTALVGVRPLAAVLNEVDVRLEERGRLNMETGRYT